MFTFVLVSLIIYLFVFYRFFGLFVCLCFFVYLSVCFIVCLSIDSLVSQSIFIYLFIYIFIYLFIYLIVCLFDLVDLLGPPPQRESTEMLDYSISRSLTL